jgi:hypothetical protein
MIKNVLVSSALLVVGLVSGVSLDRILAGDAPASTPGASISASSGTSLASRQPAYGTSASIDAGQMRSMLREELGSALTAALARSGDNGRAAAEPRSTQASAPVMTTSPQQQQEAIQVANDLVTGGQWGDSERISFHQQLAQLDPAQAEQAMQRLVQAIDSGSLKVSTEGPPL